MSCQSAGTRDLGNYFLYAFAYDSAHNYARVRTDSFRYDPDVPDVSFVQDFVFYNVSDTYYTNLSLVLNFSNEDRWLMCNLTMTGPATAWLPPGHPQPV